MVILRYAKSYVIERKWNSTTSLTIQSHIERCFAAHFEIETASQHVTEKIPNQRTQVQNFLDSFEGCTDSKVCAHVSTVSTKINGTSDNFELALPQLLPAFPIAANIRSKRNNSQISTLGGYLLKRHRSQKWSPTVVLQDS